MPSDAASAVATHFDAWIKSLNTRERIVAGFIVMWFIATPPMFLALFIVTGAFRALRSEPVLVGPLAIYAAVFALIVAWKERRMFVGLGEVEDAE